MLKNTQQKYGLIAKVIHWLVALTVIGLFAVGLWMVELDYYSAWYTKAPYYHKSVGIVLAMIMLFRLAWKFANISPNPVSNHSAREVLGAKIAHWLFYILILMMIISGYLISTADDRSIEVFGVFEVPALGSVFENQEDTAGLIHEWLAYVLIALASFHALAALKHHVLDKDDTLKRML